MSETVITYNDVTIRFVKTEREEVTTLYDESGTAWAVRHSLTFRGVIHHYTPSTFQTSLSQFQRSLSVPRQRLVITRAGVTATDHYGAYSGATSGDLDNGPFPRGMAVLEVFGGRSAIVTGTFEWTEPIVGAATPVILSHDWNQTFGTTDDAMATRTVVGTIRLSSRMNNVSVDAFRCYVWPLETAGFKVDSAEFAVSRDQRTLVYQVVQREMYRPFPLGIIKAEGSMEIEVQGASAITKTLSLRLEATKYQPKNVLFAAIADIMAQRFDFSGSKDNIVHYKMRENLWGANSVEWQATAVGRFENPTKLGPHGNSLFRRLTTTTTGTLGQQGRFKQLNAYGSSLVYAAFHALFDPVSDGNPANAAATTKAATLRWDRKDLIDDDGDGFKDISCAGIAAIDAAELPPDLTSDEIRIRLTEGKETVSEAQKTANPYLPSEVMISRRVENNLRILKSADPDEDDEVQQIGKPTVVETHSGVLRRLGAPPEVRPPEPLTRSTRRAVCPVSVVQPLTPAPMGDGSGIVYAAAYLFELRYPAIPDDSTNWTSGTISLQGGGSLPYVAFKQGQNVAAPQNPQLATGAAAPLAITNGSGTTFV